MVKALAVIATLLAIATLAAAQMSSCPAKYRYQWFYVMNDPSPANLKALDGIVMKWMRDDCGKVVTYGQGAAISSKPATFGFTAASATAVFADYGAWSNWASLDDFKSCLQNGIKSGNVAAARKFMKSASRVVYELVNCPSTTHTPATVRYMYNYVMKEFSPANCKKAAEVQAIITKGMMRSDYGCDALKGDMTVFGANVPVTAHYGGSDDFKSEKDMTAWLTLDDPKTTPALKELRSLAASATRVAIALPANAYTGSGSAKVAKERGVMP